MVRGYTGAAVKAFATAVFARYGRICVFCGEGNSDTVEHLKPRSTHPELTWDIDNARPAHRSCNSARRDRPLPAGFHATGW